MTAEGVRAAPLLAAAILLGGCAAEAADPPRLAVVLMVDQLPVELVERYDHAFEGGLRRLFDGGAVFDDAVHDHAITFTGPGHASPVTGVVPARHGIVGNSWRERDGEGWRSVNADDDPAATVVGGTGRGRSPANLLRDALPDWIRARHSAARVVSISGKAPVAVLMGGRGRAAHVYWFDTGVAGFATSDHYRPDLPGWVERFNDEAPARLAGDGCWRAEAPPEVAALARRDTVPYEADGVHTFFPHCEASDAYGGLASWISRTPALDRLTLALAREAILELDLGTGAAPDYLAIGLSATDRVGHRWGPFSREQLENLLALDRELGRFLEFLDERVGSDGYVVALSSDHGVLAMPEHRVEEGAFGRRVNAELPAVLEAAAERSGSDREGFGRLLEETPWIEQALPLEVLAGTAAPDSFVTLYRNSFHPERLSSRLAAHGLELRLREGALDRRTGTTHGVAYLHDRRVPMLFYGPGVEAGRRSGPVRTVDLAPTLASLLGVEVPADLDGRALDVTRR